MRRLLFVDDEPRLLDGLQRLLRPQRGVWDMTFASGGEEALRNLMRQPFDVIISDMRMPGLDGADLLGRVAKEWPGVIRMVLSGHTDVNVTMRTVPFAHQFLAKPCDPAILQEVIERACALRDLLASDELLQLVGAIKALPTVPHVYATLTRALADANTSITDIAGIIEQDSSIAAKTLQLVNSAFFGQRREISSLIQATSLLGTDLIRTLVLSQEIFRPVRGQAWPAGFHLEEEQRHGLRVGSLARKLVSRRTEGDQAFISGVLHDIGKLVLASLDPDTISHAVRTIDATGFPEVPVDAAALGVFHAEVGAYLLGVWGLPYVVVEAVACHHSPLRLPRTRVDIPIIIHVADALIHELTAGLPVDDALPPRLDPALLEAPFELGEKLSDWRTLALEIVEETESWGS
ncbi:MAG: response regulator [Gemmatimonadota bacterium]